MKIHSLATAVVLGLLNLALTAESARSAEPEWKVGLARVKITPEQPIHLAGYASRTHPFEKVTADLNAKALALEDRQGHVGVIVTTDLIGLTAAVANPVCERIAAKTGLKRDQILINSSHIHTGPSLTMERVPDGASEGDRQRTLAYTRHLQDQLVELVVKALEKREPANLAWGTGVVDFPMNRREFTPRGVILGVNARGPADRSVPVLRIDGADGKLRAVLMGAGTHNTTLTDTCYEVCGDYSGFAQALLEEQNPGASALFMLGCAGDSNPYPRGTMEQARAHGAVLAKEVSRVLAGKMQPIGGPLTTAFGMVELPLQAPPARAELEKQRTGKSLQAFSANQMLAMLDRGEKLPTHYTCPVAVWQFGGDLTLVGLSGEVVVDYIALLEKALGPIRLWPVAYCNDVFGYLPSARVLNEGGYETRGLYEGTGMFAPAAQDLLVAKIRELAVQVGRQVPK
jgi:neutral ceramidase